MSKQSLSRLAGAAIFACGLAVGGPAFAADQTAGVHEPPAKARAADPVETRIAEIHQRIGVTADQEQSFGVLAQVMRDNRKAHDDGRRDVDKARETITAVDDLKVYAQMAQIHADGLKRLSDAFETFYLTLSDAQKKQADVMFRDYKHANGAAPHRPHEGMRSQPNGQ